MGASHHRRTDRRGLGELKAQGRSTGNPPFGYLADSAGRLEPNPQEQVIVDIVVTRRAQGAQGWPSRPSLMS